MSEFENSLIKGIHKSRYIASWHRVGGSKIEPAWYYASRSNKKNFANWLRTLVINGEHLTEDEIHSIYTFATNGKLELQYFAEQYLKSGAQSKES